MSLGTISQGTYFDYPRLKRVTLKVHVWGMTYCQGVRETLIMAPRRKLQETLPVNINKKHPNKVTHSMVPITLSLLSDANINTLKDFAESIWRITYRHVISDAQMRYMLDHLYDPEILREQVASGNPLLGAFSGDALVGYAHVFIEGHQSRLDKLYVDTLYQGQGIGRELINAAEQYALGHDCSLMTLRVNRNNINAVAAYERFGFGIVATNKKDIGGGYVMDDYLMLKDLGP